MAEFEILRGTFKVTFRKEIIENSEQNKTENGQKWTEVDRNEIITSFESNQAKIIYVK